MTYNLSSKCTKKYYNRTLTVQISQKQLLDTMPTRTGIYDH